MRRLQSFASVLFKAVILLFATVKVLHSQQCLEPCTYKFEITTSEISIQVTEASLPCHVHNTTFNQTGGTLIIDELTPGTIYSFTINCTGVQKCCSSNHTTQAVNLTVMHINTTAVNVTWTGSLVANSSFTFTTRPQEVSDLTASEVTSESVSLTWVKGLGESPFYRVLWERKDPFLTGSKSTTDASATITGLIPGTKYEFRVKSVAADNQTEGAQSHALPVTTNPGIAENITAVQGNSSLNVSWDKPQGSVERYEVQLGEHNESTKSLHVEFKNLQAGTVYNCSVTSVLGDKNNTSNSVELATKPNPPDSVSISNRNTSSLSLTWNTPLQMSSATQLSYAVSYSGSSTEQVTKDDSVILSSLDSGILYSINVTTIGPQNLRSSTVSLAEYTLPNPVTNLRSTSLSTTSVELKWDHPLQHQSYYTYVVQTLSQTQTNQTESESSEITGLQPGTEYNFSVTTTISLSPTVQGQSEYVLGYTKPKTVANLSAVALNTTQIRLTWDRPPDHKEYYTYEAQIVGGSVKSASGSSIDFDNLVPGTNYTFRVITKANNETSQPADVSSFTKIGKATGLTAIGTTTTMTVTWVSPTGNVEAYFITIHQNQTLIENVTKETNQEVVFQNLLPGKTYTITVTTKSGPFQEDSNVVTNATYPNPPRDIVVEQSTNSSLSLKWERPLNMSPGEYSFSVTIGDTLSATTTNDNITVNDLVSGTPYNITVITVGPMNYESTAVTVLKYTNPNPLSELKQLGLNTVNVTVSWTQSDAKEGYKYQVTAYHPNGKQVGIPFNISVTTATIEGLASGAEYNVTVITQTLGGTKAPAKSIIAFTKPYPITGLVAITQNDSAVFLNWTKPIDFPSGGIYYITTNCSNAQPNRTVQVETIYITGLSPGISCFSTVYSQVNNISGDPVSIEYSTKPPKVFPEVRHVGKNGTLYVTWTPVKGVDKYIVSLATAGVPTQTVNISNNDSTNHNLSYAFSDLLPATIYTVTITTVSGYFSESSDPVSIATYPTKPGAITIIEKTTGSITLAWESAPNMTSGSFNYTVTYETTGANSSEITTTNTTQLLSGLSSGTPYNISVASVGPMDLKSDSVFVYPVTTRPKSITGLRVSATTTNTITVRWTPPSDFKDGYKYNVSDTNGISSDTTPDNEFTFTGLSPGSSYSFSVQTLTADNTGGALVNTSGCTVAAEVSPLTCTGPNRTGAILQLTWDNPPGSNTGFEIWLGNGSKGKILTCNPKCDHNFSNLSYYTDYTVNIETKGCGESSSVKSVSCKTGITVPPQMSTENTVTASNIEYNKFNLQLSNSLFNNTSGPVVAYGILITSDTGTENNGGASNYLSNTHSDWTAGKTTTYLAVGQEFPEASKAVSKRSRRSTDTVTVEIGNDSQWNNYINGPLSAKGSYSYAVVTFTKLETQNGLISITESYFSITAFHTTPVDLPENPAVIGGAIGGGIAAIVIILIVVMIIVATFKRKKNKEDTPGVPIHSIRNKVSEPIKVEDYEAHYRRQRADSFCGFAEEFEDLKPVGINQPKNCAISPENRTKNRYNNVLPYDNSRVKLSVHGSPFDDYINASNMPGYNSRKEFIAAQGPLPVTVNDFWRMIWEKNVHTVVMLTRCNEQGRVKCEEYWPAGQETKHFSNLIVNTTSEIPLEDWTIRDFDVKNVKTAETRAVRHFHFTAWPDHGVPETTELLINFRHLVREHMDQYSRHSPTMVHCSAGVGRTGTFIAIDRLIFQIERDGVVDIYGIIHDLRMHRTLMVQTEDQYVFLNQCAIDIIRSRTGTNVDLIYQNTAALTIYENFEPMKKSKNGYHKA